MPDPQGQESSRVAEDTLSDKLRMKSLEKAEQNVDERACIRQSIAGRKRLWRKGGLRVRGVEKCRVREIDGSELCARTNTVVVVEAVWRIVQSIIVELKRVYTRAIITK